MTNSSCQLSRAPALNSTASTLGRGGGYGASPFVSDYFVAVVAKIVLELLSGFRYSGANATNPSTLVAQVRPHTFPFALLIALLIIGALWAGSRVATSINRP